MRVGELHKYFTNIKINGVFANQQIYWLMELEPDTKGSVRYHLQLPTDEGDYLFTTETSYFNNGQYLFYSEIPVFISLISDRQLIKELILTLETQRQTNDSNVVNQIIADLRGINDTVINNPNSYDNFINKIIQSIDKWQKNSSIDTEIVE